MPASFARFFVYSNLFIAVCAVLMLQQTYIFLLSFSPDPYLTGFVFFSTVCSYSFHWWLTEDSVLPSERINWLKKYRYVHVFLLLVGLAGAAWYFWIIRDVWFWLIPAIMATFLYSAPKIPHPWARSLRKLALGKTIFLALIWTYVTTVLPIVISDQPWITPFSLFVISRFFLVYAICILFDYRDREDDKAAGIRSLITFLNEKNIRILFVSSLLVFGFSSIGLLWYDYTSLNIVLLLVPGIITAFLFNYARRHFSDMFYYLVLDGLMALSALLMLLTSI
ncbi:MAG TPA: UbiA family prenyltransferase [Chitinophagaceae bacterium]|nr:UbiA family prenyltransferase [Chitinophagaceae bacterium]